jgi:hypothetical protein
MGAFQIGSTMKKMKKNDAVNHPKHYTSHPSGIEAIEVCEHYCFNIGNAIKYLWRAGIKSEDPIEDLEKASWYIAREIGRLMEGRRAGRRRRVK